MKLLFAHVETSGLDAATGEILELSFQLWEDGKRSVVTNDKFCAIGNTNAPAFKEAAALNGYKDGVTLPTFRAAFLERFFAELEKAEGALIACGPTLTVEFLKETAKRYGVPCPRIRVLDVASLAIPLLMAGKVQGLNLTDLVAGLCPDKPAPKNSIDKVERAADVFEQCVVRYFAALVPQNGGTK